MSSSVSLALYRAATRLIEPGAGLLLRRRERLGKEDAARLGERLGRTNVPRPDGAVAWVHGASVGESLAVLPLVERLVHRGFHVVLTSGTVSSSRVLASRLSPGVVHQFVPLDVPGAVRRFFEHWQPDLVCFVESELWPNLIEAARTRGIPAVLVNARMSTRSFARWRRIPGTIRPLLGDFDLILAQSDADARRLQALGASDVQTTGNLKYDADPPPADTVELQTLQTAIGNRPVWVAASTHAGEDLLCVAVHRRLAAHWPGLLSIIIPRRSDRGPVIVAEAERLGLQPRLRSRRDLIDQAAGIYIADTMGDIGLFYRLSRLVFVGKSLADRGGGQNPIEPAKLGCAILHGPRVANFAAVYSDLDEGGGSRTVNDEAGLAAAVSEALADPGEMERTAQAAQATVARRAGATERTMQMIEYLCAAASGVAG